MTTKREQKPNTRSWVTSRRERKTAHATARQAKIAAKGLEDTALHLSMTMWNAAYALADLGDVHVSRVLGHAFLEALRMKTEGLQ